MTWRNQPRVIWVFSVPVLFLNAATNIYIQWSKKISMGCTKINSIVSLPLRSPSVGRKSFVQLEAFLRSFRSPFFSIMFQRLPPPRRRSRRFHPATNRCRMCRSKWLTIRRRRRRRWSFRPQNRRRRRRRTKSRAKPKRRRTVRFVELTDRRRLLDAHLHFTKMPSPIGIVRIRNRVRMRMPKRVKPVVEILLYLSFFLFV